MAPQSFVTEWNATTGVLEAVRSPAAAPAYDPAHDPAESARELAFDFQAVASVSFAPDGGVCSVNVPDTPDRVAVAIPAARGQETVGFAWVDSGWLWIPLTYEQVARKRSGLADVELRLNQSGVTGLVLRFVDQETKT
uniref:Uncharacterized protein n=1 Tax=Streptomyces sp. NBC_00049 TaxID=2903617 RepID=A0AAU2JR13_9ACTN